MWSTDKAANHNAIHIDVKNQQKNLNPAVQ